VGVIIPSEQSRTKGMYLEYPETRRDDVVDIYHSVNVEDPFRWLEDLSNPEVQAWIDRQNKLTDSILNSLSGRTIVQERTTELLKHESISNLMIRETPRGIRIFYLYKHPTVNQAVLCYQDGEDGERIEIVNPLDMKTDGSIAIDSHGIYPSWDGRYVAYGVSKSGTEDSTLHVHDLSTNKGLSDVIPRTRWVDLAWNQESTGFYYTRYPLLGTVSEDEMNYNRHVYYHELGSDYHDDPKVFGEGRNPTEMYHVYSHSKNDWILLIAWRYNSADVYLTRMSSNWKVSLLIESESGICYAYLSEDSIFLISFIDTPNGRIDRYRLDDFLDPDWTPAGVVVVEEGEYAISHISTTGYLSFAVKKNASHEIRIHDLESGSHLETIEFPSPVSVTDIITCPKTHKLYLPITAYIHPDTIQTYVVGEGLGSFLTPEVALDSNEFNVELVWFKSKDDTKVSMFLVSANKTSPRKETPILIRGYGTGGIPYMPMFFPEYIIWLEKGGILAIPHIRGGGEYGEKWHKMGHRKHKQNSFDDFISAIEWLHENGYGNPETTAIMGRSAGGLLVGAVAVQRPELFSSVYCAVPILDMVRYTEFTVAKIWMSEYGNPEIEEEFGWLFSYSPYHHVIKDTRYPAVLLYTALGDIRCDPTHAMKMAARMQTATSSEITTRPIVLSVDHEAGHGVGLSTEKLIEIRTNQVIFHARHTGLEVT